MYSAEKSKSPYVSYRNRQRGFTLVEFMVAMALGLVIMLAVSEIFVNNSQARSEIERVSRQIENGRFALQLLSDEIANAGFFGESGVPSLPAAAPAVCLRTESDVLGSIALPIVGGDNIAATAAPVCLSSYKGRNDYIAIRRSSTCAVGTPGCDDFRSNHFHMQVAACRDATGSITSHAVGDVVLARASTDMTALSRTCTSIKAPIYRYLSRVYYVRSDDVLVRSELQDPAVSPRYQKTPMVEGIERLHFEYGLDNTGDGVADEYVGSVAATDPEWESWSDVVVVRISLLARALEVTPGYLDTNTYTFPGGVTYTPNDGFKRQLYSAVVRVNSVSGRRE